MDFTIYREGQLFRIETGDDTDSAPVIERALRILCVDDRDVSILEDGYVEARVADGVTITDVIGMIACSEESQSSAVVDVGPL